MWLTGILQWGLGGTGKTVYWKQEGNYFNEYRYDTACHTLYRSNSHDEAKPGNKTNTPLEESPVGARSVIMSFSVGPGGRNSSMTVALVKRSFFSAHKQGHPQWAVLTENSFDVSFCKLLLEQHFCYKPVTDPKLYLLLWYKVYVQEVQEALGAQASQAGPGKRKWKKEDIIQK